MEAHREDGHRFALFCQLRLPSHLQKDQTSLNQMVLMGVGEVQVWVELMVGGVQM